MEHIFWVTAIFTWVTFFQMRSHLLKILLLLPGTAAHELSHWLVALVLGCRPGFPNLWPRRQPFGWTLGSVSFQAHFGRTAFVALSPAWLLAPLIWTSASWVPGYLASSTLPVIAQKMLSGALVGYGAHSVLPSSADWDIALHDPVGFTGVILLAAIAAHFSGYLALFP